MEYTKLTAYSRKRFREDVFQEKTLWTVFSPLIPHLGARGLTLFVSPRRIICFPSPERDLPPLCGEDRSSPHVFRVPVLVVREIQ